MRHWQYAAVIFLFGSTAAVAAPNFEGKWHGTFHNTLGEKGDTKLVLDELDGKFTGVWDDVKVNGKRANPNTLELHGQNDERSYQLTVTIEKGEMTINYVVTYRKKKGSYEGKATLVRR
jgi:hypothetical protein